MPIQNYMKHSNFGKFCQNHWTLMFMLHVFDMEKKKFAAKLIEKLEAKKAVHLFCYSNRNESETDPVFASKRKTIWSETGRTLAWRSSEFAVSYLLYCTLPYCTVLYCIVLDNCALYSTTAMSHRLSQAA